MYQNSYHNTNKEAGTTLAESEHNAKRQEDIILHWLKAQPGREYTPEEIQQGAGLERSPITSVRRAITNLTKWSLLEKTDTMREGNYGKLVHCWKFPVPEPVQTSLF